MLPEQASNHDGRTSTLPREGQGVRGSGAWRKWRGKVTQSRSCDYWEKRHGAKSINDRERQVVESHIESWKTTSGCSIHFHWGHIAQWHLLRRYKRLKTALKRGNKNITFSYNYQEATRGGMKMVKLTKQTDNWSGFKQHIAYRWSWRAQIRFPKSGQVAETADHNRRFGEFLISTNSNTGLTVNFKVELLIYTQVVCQL